MRFVAARFVAALFVAALFVAALFVAVRKVAMSSTMPQFPDPYSPPSDQLANKPEGPKRRSFGCCRSGKYKLDKPPKYEVTEAGSGTWQTYTFSDGARFGRYASHFTVGDRPFLSIAFGPDPETGKAAVAEGFIAIGQYARGTLAIGQMVNGVFAIGQFATARVAGIGQFIVAPLAVGQFSIAVAAVAQMGIAATGIFQFGLTLLGGIGQIVIDLAAGLI